MLAFAPMAAFIALSENAHKGDCKSRGLQGCEQHDAGIYGGLIGALVLLGGGGSLVAIGAKKEPVKPDQARVSVWATPRAFGFGLRLEL